MQAIRSDVRDPHRILGVEPGASPDAIKRAYRSLARRHHPDATGDAASAERFAEIAAAYEQLLTDSTPESRRGNTPTDGGSPSCDDAADPAEAGQVYDAFFGSGGAATPEARRSRRPPFTRRAGSLDLELELPVSRQEAEQGGDIVIPSGREPRTVRVPPGTRSGDTLRISDAGVRGRGGVMGDLILRIRVVPASGDPLDLGT